MWKEKVKFGRSDGRRTGSVHHLREQQPRIASNSKYLDEDIQDQESRGRARAVKWLLDCLVAWVDATSHVHGQGD
jgi:hypothetical protein